MTTAPSPPSTAPAAPPAEELAAKPDAESVKRKEYAMRRDSHREEMWGFDRALHESWIWSALDTLAECEAELRLAAAAQSDPCLITEYYPEDMTNGAIMNSHRAQSLLHRVAMFDSNRYSDMVAYLDRLPPELRDEALSNYNNSWRKHRVAYQAERESRRLKYREEREARVDYDSTE